MIHFLATLKVHDVSTDLFYQTTLRHGLTRRQWQSLVLAAVQILKVTEPRRFSGARIDFQRRAAALKLARPLSDQSLIFDEAEVSQERNHHLFLEMAAQILEFICIRQSTRILRVVQCDETPISIRQWAISKRNDFLHTLLTVESVSGLSLPFLPDQAPVCSSRVARAER